MLHAAYLGSTDSDGYPTGDGYGTPVQRDSYGWYPLSSQLNPSGDYDLRVITSKVMLVPDPAVFKPRDQVTLPGNDVYFVSEDVRDYRTGPYSPPAEHGGEVVLEKVTG